jgi:hypothetical protein
MTDTLQELAEKLAAPTPETEVYFFPSALVGQDSHNPKGLCVPYTSRQFVEDRLDAVVGAFGWQTEVRAEAGVLCFGISIQHPDSGIWLCKWDTGAEGTDDAANQSVTGGIKRAGRLWGIGRDVSRLVAKWRPCTVKMRRGKQVFDQWVEEPTLAEIVQFTNWIRKNSSPDTENEKEGADESDGNGKSKSTGRSAAAPVRADGGGMVGGDPTSQFWYTARGLINAGVLKQHDVDGIVAANTDSAGRVSFKAAKAELDQYVPAESKAAEKADDIPF